MKDVTRIQRNVMIAVCAALVLVIMILGITMCRNKNKDEGFVARFVRFTDQATGISYDIGHGISTEERRIPYDGLVHTFAYTVLSIEGEKPLGQSGVFEKDNHYDVAKEPGMYSYQVLTSHNGYDRTITLRIVIEEPEKLQPIMKFEPNGAIEYTDGEYYKYKYTGDYCHPIAYAEYEGTRLDCIGEAFIPHCVPDYAPNTSIAAPVKVGKYKVTFSIAEYVQDPHLETYYSVRKTITVEIIE